MTITQSAYAHSRKSVKLSSISLVNCWVRTGKAVWPVELCVMQPTQLIDAGSIQLYSTTNFVTRCS